MILLHIARRKWYDVIKQGLRKLLTFIWIKLINLNIFAAHNFGSINDRGRTKRLGQLATRLYVILLISILIIFSLYTVIKPQTLKKTFVNPSLDIYNHLIQDHGDTLQCSCALVSLAYDRFIKVEPIFHQICTSLFASDEWRRNITVNLVPDLSTYVLRDYRRFISAHLQLLNGLCNLSIQSVNISVNQLLSSLLITAELLPQTILQERIDSLINQTKSNAPTTLVRLLFLLRMMNYENAVVSTYGTNYEYIISEVNPFQQLVPTQAVIYDDGCSCEFHMNCTTQASFVVENSSETAPIKGLKIGCTPSESFLASTLECFYDASCISLIEKQMYYMDNNNITHIQALMSVKKSRFALDTPIVDLINDLFIENWSVTINYSLYFDQCSPALCSYTYTQEFNSLHTITILIGLYGGLTIFLKWFCPSFIHLAIKIYQYWKKRTNRVEAVQSMERPLGEATNIARSLAVISITDTDVESAATVVAPQTKLLSTPLHRLVFGFLLTMVVVAFIVPPCIHLSRKSKDHRTQTVLSTSSTTTTTMIISTVSPCQLTFQPGVRYPTGYSNSDPYSLAIVDLNGDKYLDLAVTISGPSNVAVLLGNGNGTFGVAGTFLADNSTGMFSMWIATGDFDHDGHLDVVISNGLYSVYVMLGNGDGTFGKSIGILTSPYNIPFTVAVGDFNIDDQLDLVFSLPSAKNVILVLGNGDGTFREPIIVSADVEKGPASSTVCDFDRDGLEDLAITGIGTGSIDIFLGKGDGTFRKPMAYSRDGYTAPNLVVVADFNNDNRSDLATTNFGLSGISVLLGNGNGTFREVTTFSTSRFGNPSAIVVGDINHDNQLDLAVTNVNLANVDVLLGNGMGAFELVMTFPIGMDSYPESLATADFNNDGLLDFVVTASSWDCVLIYFNTCKCCLSTLAQNESSTHN